MPTRPISPHLTVYKFKYTLMTSILNRLTGLGLSAGLLLLVYWLVAIGSGAHAYARAARVLSAPLTKVVYLGFIVAFAYHLSAGLRHLVWDTGRGLERAQSQRSAWLIAAASAALTALIAYYAWRAGARAP
ncbi:MAG TPA: succinate dehydrogenase, cytochrome b556 subunit [Candidatus Dormibacteraeota bacterium]|nr:succinate dehydrogenase, cytochrome b556 subunit [Candidatus Dormibacteraeota bacterium]